MGMEVWLSFPFLSYPSFLNLLNLLKAPIPPPPTKDSLILIKYWGNIGIKVSEAGEKAHQFKNMATQNYECVALVPGS